LLGSAASGLTNSCCDSTLLALSVSRATRPELAAGASSRRVITAILILITSPHRDRPPTHFLAYSRSASNKLEGLMNGQVINYRVEGAKYGISFGTALAIAISYTNNHSVLWAIIHGFFSWLYVIYYVLFK